MIQNSSRIAGHVGRPPEVFSSEKGEVIKFSVCINDRYRNKNNEEWVERQTWVPCVCFQSGRVKYLKENLKSGSYIIIEGYLQTNEFVSQKYFDASGKPFRDDKLQLVVEEFLLPEAHQKRQNQPPQVQAPSEQPAAKPAVAFQEDNSEDPY